MRPAVIFDLDGTLCDTTHRKHLLPENKSITSDDWDNDLAKDAWREFHMWCGHDTLIHPVAEILYQYWIKNTKIIFCTARPFYVYDLTIGWISKHIPGIKGFYNIYMREIDDKRKSAILKLEMLEHIRKEYNVVCAFEDHPEAIKMFNDNGVLCLKPCISNNRFGELNAI